MTQAEFNQIFKDLTPQWKYYSLTDRRICYNELMEAFRRDGNITEKQARDWGHPKFLTSFIMEIDLNKY